MAPDPIERRLTTATVTGHQITRRYRLPDLDRTPRPFPQMGEHESECRSQLFGSGLLARCSCGNGHGGRWNIWCCGCSKCVDAAFDNCFGVSGILVWLYLCYMADDDVAQVSKHLDGWVLAQGASSGEDGSQHVWNWSIASVC